MKDLLKNKRFLILLGVIGVAIIALVVILVITIGNKNEKEEKNVLENNLKDLAAKFYVEQYYSQVKSENELKDLESFKDNGLNVTITGLKVVLPLGEETESLLEERKCNYDTSKIMIYPKEPYGEKDYTIKVELACEK